MIDLDEQLGYTPRIGSICSGYGGLDRAAEEFFGAETVWHVEYDTAPAKILEHHWPDVPNFGDLTAVDWSTVEPVDIVSAGFPCQDVSGAGRMAGLRPGTRTGLWLYIVVFLWLAFGVATIWPALAGQLIGKVYAALAYLVIGKGVARGSVLRQSRRLPAST